MIKVLVVDDQNLTQRLVETYLQSETEISIVGFANDGQEAIEKIPPLQPDIVLMDVEMPTMDGLSATKIISQKYPETKVLILTVHDNEQHLSTALKNGARGYLLKTTTSQELKKAINFANQGYFQLSLELTEKYLQKIIKTKSETEDVAEVKRKLNYLYKSLNKLETRLEHDLSHSFDDNVEHKVQGLLKKEMALLRDRDSHLQFKVDRMKHSQERLEQSLKYLMKVQLGCIAIALVSIVLSIFAHFN